MEYDNPLTDENADNSNQRDERKLFQKQGLILVVDGRRSGREWEKRDDPSIIMGADINRIV